MNGGQVRIGSAAEQLGDESPVVEAFGWMPEPEAPAEPPLQSRAGAVLAGLAIVLALVWVAGAVAWALTRDIDPVLAAAAACAGPKLIGVIWLIATIAGGTYAEWPASTANTA